MTEEAHIQRSPKVFSPEYLGPCQLLLASGLDDLRDVQEAVLILVLFVDAAHESGSGR